jgi:amidohydrolase
VAALLQPREEGEPSGALDLVKSGALDELAVGAVIGAHVQPQVPAGTLAVTAGLVNASVDEFRITVTGQVGHVGYPHRVADPVLALAAIVVALQQIPARRVDPVTGAVCVVTEMRAGNAANIIAAEAWARGSLRVMRDGDREAMRTTLTGIAEYTARAHGCTAAVELIHGEPSLLNDAVLASGTAARLTAWGRAVSTEFRSFGADDFSWYGRGRPSLMIFVGVDGPGLHDPTFLPPDESVRAVAEAMLAGYLAAVDQLG